MMKHILGLVCLILQACSPQFNNSVDRDIVECGISREKLGSRKILRSNSQLNNGEFKIYDHNGGPLVEFEVTSKNCLILPELSHAESIVFSNGNAAWLKNDVLELRSCGQDCAVFPVCGYFKESSSQLGSWVYAKLDKPSPNLSAILEEDTGPQSLDVSEKSCVRIDSSAQGILRLSDSEGNFIESNLQDLLLTSPRQKSLLKISLREPLSKDEAYCKKNSSTHKMVQGVCLLKDLRDYCEEFKTYVGKKQIREYFKTDNCDRLWAQVETADRISFVAKGLESAKFFSNLPRLKGLNLSGNPDLGSLSEMKGTIQVEELIVSHANFDISEIALFPSLHSIAIGNVKDNWKKSPVFPQIKKLELSTFGEFDAEILKKFPNVEEIFISDEVKISGSLDFLVSFQKLKKIVLSTARIGTEIPGIPALEEIHSESLSIFKGPYPELRMVEIRSSDNLGVLRFAKKLEKIVIVEGYQDIEYTELEGLVFEHVKFAVLPKVPTFRVLNSFPSLEHLEIQLHGLGWKGYLERFDTLPFQNLGSLTYLKITTGDFWDDIIPFQNLSFPKLENLHLTCGCDLKNLNLPALKKMDLEISLESLDLKSFTMPNLESVYLYMPTIDSIDIGILPKLKNFSAREPLSLNFLKDKVPNLESVGLSSEYQKTIDYVPHHIKSLLLSGYHFDFNSIADFPFLQELYLKSSDFESIENDASDRTIRLDSLYIVTTDSLELDMKKVPRFVPTRFEGKLSDQILEKVSLSETTELKTMEYRELVDLLTSVVYPKLKILDTFGYFSENDSHERLLSIFPSLEKLEGLSVDTDYLFSQDGQINEVAFDLLKRFPSSHFNLFGKLDDKVWSALNCENSYREKSILGRICRYPGVSKDDWDYRPSYFFKWDYE